MMDSRNGKTRAAIYLRVSTDKQELENQERQLTPYCERSGWDIHKVYRDVISGKEEKRPAFDELFRDAHQKKFDILLFWDLSRFSRAGTLHTLQKLRELENLGIGWHSYTEPYVSTAGQFKDVVIALLSSLAKVEREKISTKTKAGLERARAQGKKLGKQFRITDTKIKRVWREYGKEGSITRVAKVLKGIISKGTIQFIVSHGIRTKKQYIEVYTRWKAVNRPLPKKCVPSGQ